MLFSRKEGELFTSGVETLEVVEVNPPTCDNCHYYVEGSCANDFEDSGDCEIMVADPSYPLGFYRRFFVFKKITDQ